jgi:predicted transcriptional regulator
MPQTEVISLRLPSEHRKALQKMADVGERSLSSQIRIAIREYVERAVERAREKYVRGAK